jgi:hypothetical protein
MATAGTQRAHCRGCPADPRPQPHRLWKVFGPKASDVACDSLMEGLSVPDIEKTTRSRCRAEYATVAHAADIHSRCCILPNVTRITPRRNSPVYHP